MESEMYAAERYERRAARDAAPQWSFEPRWVEDGFDLALEAEGRR